LHLNLKCSTKKIKASRRIQKKDENASFFYAYLLSLKEPTYQTFEMTSLEFVTYILTFYGYSFMLIFGTIGNLLNIALFFRKKLRRTSCNNCK
jgi:hypothetical protein